MHARDLSAGAPCWMDLSTSDATVAREFYPALFGWTAEAPSEEFGGYFMFNHKGVPVAGGMPAMPDTPTSSANSSTQPSKSPLSVRWQYSAMVKRIFSSAVI